MNYFLIGLWHATKSGFYMTIGHDQLSGWTDKKLQSTFQSRTLNLHQENVIVTVWWSAAHRLHCGFLNLGETITSEKYAQQINEMHQKSQCLQPALVNRKGPVLLHNNDWPHVAQWTLQKLSKLGYSILPHLPYSPDLLPTDYTYSSILTTFYRENTSTTGSKQKMLSKSSLNPEAQTFMLQEKTYLFLVGTNVLIIMVPILINKDVVKSSYNDLKFMVQNCKFVCTNLTVYLKLTQHCKSTLLIFKKKTKPPLKFINHLLWTRILGCLSSTCSSVWLLF